MESINKNIQENRRHYTRISTILPVVVHFTAFSDNSSQVKKFQGFTRDISKDGFCLEINELDDEFTKYLEDHSFLRVSLDVPYQKDPIYSDVKIAWKKKVSEIHFDKYLMGVHLESLPTESREKLFKFALLNKRKPYIIFGVIFFFAFLALIFHQISCETKKDLQNTEIALKVTNDKLIEIQEERNKFENRLISMNKHFYMMEKKIKEYEEKEIMLKSYSKENEQEEIKKLKEELDIAKKEEAKAKIKAVDYLSEKRNIEDDLHKLLKEKESISKEFQEISKAKKNLENILDKLESVNDWVVFNVLLKNGISLTGEVVSENSNELRLKVGKGIVNIDKKWIDRIKEINLSSKLELEEKWRKEETFELGRMEKIDRKPITPQIPSLVPHITIQNRRLHVNGKLFYIKGVGYGIEYPKMQGSMNDFNKIPFKVFEKDFKMMKDANINVIRTYEPLNEKLLDLAYKNGIMVIENVCYPTGSTDYKSSLHLSLLIENALQTVKKHKNHKAILMWSIWNDAPWVWDLGGGPFSDYDFKTVNDFLKKIYHEVKKIDASHPVTASNVLGFNGSNLGFDFLDVLGFNMYLGGMDWYVQEDADNDINKLVEISEKYNKPVIILETGFSTFVEGLNQGDILQNQISTIGEKIAGVCFFQWADGWNKAGAKDVQDYHIEEHWGLLTGYREPKSGFNTVSSVFKSIPTESNGFRN